MKKTITQQLNKFFEAAAVKAKTAGFTCALLSVITVICVGFSSWIIVNPNVKYTVNASPFEVYTVTDSQNYITLSDVTGFSYYYTGFTDGKGNLKPTGDISFNVDFKSGNAQAFLEATKGMNLQFTLYFTDIKNDYFTVIKDNINIPAAKIIPPATCDIGGKTNITCERSIENGEYFLRASVLSSDIGITASSPENYFTVTFKLANSTDKLVNSTYAALYEYLQKGGSFMIEARVSKKYN